MFEMIFILLAIFVAYLLAVAIVVKRTLDMGARSGMFGVGLVSIVAGFLVYAVIGEVGLAVGYDFWNEYPSVLYYLARFGFLMLGISGIVMVAVDLFRTIGDMGGYISRVDDKIQKSKNTPEVKKSAAQPESIPTWKRVQMDTEAQSKD